MKKIGNIKYEVTGTTNQSIRIIAPKNTTLYVEKGRTNSVWSMTGEDFDWSRETKNIPSHRRTTEVYGIEKLAVEVKETEIAKQAGENPNFTKLVSKRDDSYVVMDSHFIGQLLTLSSDDGNFFYREGQLLAVVYEEGTTISLKRQMVSGNAQEGDAFRAEQLGARTLCQIKVTGTALLIFEMKGDYNKIDLDARDPRKKSICVDPMKFIVTSSRVNIRRFPSTSDSKNVRDNIGYDYFMYLEATAGNQSVYVASQTQKNYHKRI